MIFSTVRRTRTASACSVHRAWIELEELRTIAGNPPNLQNLPKGAR